MKKIANLLIFLTASLVPVHSRICSNISPNTSSYITDPSKWCWEKNGSPPEINNWVGLTYDGGNLPFPFAQNAQVGVYTTDGCLPENGWVLYDRHLNDYDFYDRALAKASSQTSDINRLPYFSLYNRRTGVLKTFIFKGKNSAIDFAGYLRIDVRITRRGTSYTGTQGITSVDTREFSIPINIPNGEQELIKYVISTSEINKWIIIDTEIGYDPNLINSGTINQYPINITYSIFSVKESAITLNGSLSTPSKSPSFFTALFKTGAAAATAGGLGFSGPIVSAIGGNILNELKSSFLNEKKEDGKLINWDAAISSGFKDASDAKIWGKVPWVSAFTQLTTSKTTLSKQKIDLSGTITETPLINEIHLPLPGADLAEYPGTERPYFFYSNPGEDLGLVSFERNPIMKLKAIYDNYTLCHSTRGCRTSELTNHYDRYFTFSLENVANLVKINPNAPMILKELKIQILEKSTLSSGYSPTLFKVYQNQKYTEWSGASSFLGVQNYYAGTVRNVPIDPYIKILLAFTPTGGGEEFIIVKTLKCNFHIEGSYSTGRILPFSGKYMLNGGTVEGPGIFNEESGINRHWTIVGLARVYSDYFTTSGKIETVVNGLTKIQFQSIGDLKPTINDIRPSSLKNLGNDGSYTNWEFYVSGVQKKVAWTLPGNLRKLTIRPLPIVSTILQPLLLD